MLILDYLQQNQGVLLASCLILGLIVGSFLNVVIYRLPLMMERSWKAECATLFDSTSQKNDSEASPAEQAPFNLVTPNSACPKCKRPIRAWENIPVLSYIFLRGRCAGCKTAISLRYPAVEILTALLSLVVGFYFGASFSTLAALLLTWCLITLSLIDADHQLLPDSITLPLLWLGLIVKYFGRFVSLKTLFGGQ